MMKRLIQWLTKPLLPIRLYYLGTGSGSFYGLSNLKNLDFSNINIPTEQKEETSVDMTNAANNAGYSNDSRTGTTNSKNGTYELDTSNYDSQIASLNDELKKYYYYAVGKNHITNMKNQYGQEASYNDYWNWRNGIQGQIDNLNKNKEKYLRDYANSTNLDKSSTQADQALQSAQQSSQGTAAGNRTANINAGINRSAAGLLGSTAASNNVGSTAAQQYSANSSNAASTQADYLEKMGQANALDQQANNISSSAGLATLSAALNGFGSGASAGAALGGVASDENCKTSPESSGQSDLNSMVMKFKELYQRLQQLKRK